MSIDIVTLPIIGAFIGYFTNYVAIKMLFYPKRPYYVRNIRVPFTPGLIPKKRNELIENISNVVAEKVINKNELVRYVYSKKNRMFLYSYTQNILNNLLDKKLSEINLPYRKIFKIASTQIEQLKKTLVREKLETLSIDFDYISYNAFLLIDKNKRVRDLIQNKNIEILYQNLEALSNNALLNLSSSLDDPEIKELIRKKITESLNDYIDESNILTASFVSMIAPLIEENEKIMDIIVDKLKQLLNDKNVKIKVKNSIAEAFDEEVMNLRLEEFLIKFTNSSLDNLRKVVSSKIKDIFGKLNIKKRIIDEIIKTIDTEKTARKIVAYLRLTLQKTTFRDTLKFIKPEFERKLSRYLVNNLLIIVRKESQQIFDFDIAENARKKLEKLDIGQVEDIVLNISKEQFKYINLFGGILGFLIGIIEVILR